MRGIVSVTTTGTTISLFESTMWRRREGGSGYIYFDFALREGGGCGCSGLVDRTTDSDSQNKKRSGPEPDRDTVGWTRDGDVSQFLINTLLVNVIYWIMRGWCKKRFDCVYIDGEEGGRRKTVTDTTKKSERAGWDKKFD